MGLVVSFLNESHLRPLNTAAAGLGGRRAGLTLCLLMSLLGALKWAAQVQPIASHTQCHLLSSQHSPAAVSKGSETDIVMGPGNSCSQRESRKGAQQVPHHTHPTHTLHRTGLLSCFPLVLWNKASDTYCAPGRVGKGSGFLETYPAKINHQPLRESDNSLKQIPATEGPQHLISPEEGGIPSQGAARSPRQTAHAQCSIQYAPWIGPRSMNATPVLENEKGVLSVLQIRVWQARPPPPGNFHPIRSSARCLALVRPFCF